MDDLARDARCKMQVILDAQDAKDLKKKKA